MITVTFSNSDGRISHEVKTRGEALALVDRYLPPQDLLEDLDERIKKINALFEQASGECVKEGVSAIYGYMVSETECIIGGNGDCIPLVMLTNKIQEIVVNELKEYLKKTKEVDKINE
ncbi:hypothetical protein D932_01659 [Enterococcus casseliflavus 14-MB-W-14]|uniref:hypothetical protein n=1 Tax=Enterococcus TaxID=1350 RepID=UPI00027227CD|nr:MULTISPECIES: hypothetical protein [Enterococcus]EJF48880.1 hypothetical protein YS9_2263 [Enterococcus sp. C1]EPH64176.1 hypothetical protein D932_01659 [Enterococcus casseliflavus 14-MB-W-14]